MLRYYFSVFHWQRRRDYRVFSIDSRPLSKHTETIIISQKARYYILNSIGYKQREGYFMSHERPQGEI